MDPDHRLDIRESEIENLRIHRPLVPTGEPDTGIGRPDGVNQMRHCGTQLRTFPLPEGMKDRSAYVKRLAQHGTVALGSQIDAYGRRWLVATLQTPEPPRGLDAA